VLPLAWSLFASTIDRDGHSAYARWFNDLNAEAAAKVAIAITRLSLGHFSSVQGLGTGVFEYKIDFGPGYRIYFGRESDTLIVLLGGGIKKRQQQDIATARARWAEYKRRK
jgi:putative addiction module killer protein